MVSATTNFTANNAASHAQGRADLDTLPARKGQGLTSQPPERPATFPSKAEHCRPRVSWPQCWRGPLSSTDRLLFQFPNAHGTQKHLNMGSDDKSDLQKHKTKIEQLWFALLHARSDDLQWDRTNFDKVRLLLTLGQTPLWTSEGSMTETSVLKRPFKTSSQRLRLGAIKRGRNTLPNFLGAHSLTELWTPQTRSYTNAKWCSWLCLLLD